MDVPAPATRELVRSAADARPMGRAGVTVIMPVIVVLPAIVGMLPASLLPVIVSGTRHGLDLTIAQAATLGGIAILSAAFGALIIALTGVPDRRRRATALSLVAMAGLDLISIAITGFLPMLVVRALHGLIGGMLAGIGYAAIGAAAAPDRLFALLLTLQFLIGGAGIAILPTLIETSGLWVLFATLAGMATLNLLLLRYMPDATRPGAVPVRQPIVRRLPSGSLLPALAALLSIQAAHTAAGAFLIDLGRSRGGDLHAVQSIVGFGAAAGVLGAVAAAVVGIRYGRRGPVMLAGAAGLLASGLLLSPSSATFAAGVMIGSVAWAWSIPFVLGACAVTGTEQGGAIWSSFVAKLGLAIGPFLGALVASERSLDAAVVLSGGLGLAGALLFYRVGPRGRHATDW